MQKVIEFLVYAILSLMLLYGAIWIVLQIARLF